KVGIDAQVSVAGVRYDVDPDLAGETVIVWFGLYDDQLYVEQGERRYGPYAPSAGPIPLHRYRRWEKTRREQQAPRIEGLACPVSGPRAALGDYPLLLPFPAPLAPTSHPSPLPPPLTSL